MAKYKIGLDIGTNSIGWCVADENLHVVRKKGRKMLGVLMFEDTQTDSVKTPNAERRAYRCARRRLNRRKQRISYLNEIFAPELAKIDVTFLERLEKSFLNKLDPNCHKDYDYNLFIEKGFNDKTYYKKFPTIYHLEKYLMESNKKEDIRLIYLACHHLIKYRGNFLHSGDPKNFTSEVKLDEFEITLQEIVDKLKEFDEFSTFDVTINHESVKKIIDSYKKDNITDRKNNFYLALVGSEKGNKLGELIAHSLAGAKVDFAKYLEQDEEEKIELKLTFNDEIDDTLQSFVAEHPDFNDYGICISELYALYQNLYLSKYVAKDLPTTMIQRFNQYRSDLDLLKEFVSKNHSDQYDYVFGNPNVSNKQIMNYSSFTGHYTIGTNFKNTKKINISKANCNREKFVSFLKKTFALDKIKIDKCKDELTVKLLKRINEPDFFLRQNDSINTTFPYQLNYYVLNKIISNQEKYYEFLNEKDEDGYVNKDKIMSLLTFKIPYYVGPLYAGENENAGKFAWLVKRENKKIRPWNFDEVVDDGTSASRFIERMQNKCTYLKDEFCLPKDSVTFQKYLVYSELNKIYVNGEFFFTAEEKDKIIDALYLKKRKITQKDFIDYVKNVTHDDNAIIRYGNANGKELEKKLQSLSSLYDFINIFKSRDYVEKNIEMIEKIIRDIAIFEDKSVLERRLKNEYKFDKDTIKKIKALNYSKFSNLSYKLLAIIKPYDSNGELIDTTILKILKNATKDENSPKVLLEILGDVNNPSGDGLIYNFKPYFKKEEVGEKELYEYVNDLPLASASRRPIILSCNIIEELKTVLHCSYDDLQFYIETTRTNKAVKGDKGRTKSRYEKLLETYKNAGITDAVKSVLNELEEIHESGGDAKLNGEALFLYFIQQGKDLYTGEPIHLEEMEKYDVDHIIPQCLIKDDSLENKVLTLKTFNEKIKHDDYPLKPEWLWKNTGGATEAHKFYKYLYDKKFIGSKKYNSLISRNQLGDKELQIFVDSQLNTTNHIVIGLRDCLINFFNCPASNIEFSKAEVVSDFRKEKGLIKSREANNFHHAHDAYLNIVTWSIVRAKTNKVYSKFKGSTYSNLKEFADAKHFTLNPSKMVYWYFENNPDLMKEIEDLIYNYKFIFTKTRTYIKKRLFGKVTIHRRNNQGNISVKQNLPAEYYGGLKEYSFGSMTLIKANNDYIIEAIPSAFSSNVKGYIESQKEYSNKKIEIIIPVLKINTKIKQGETEFVLTGKTGTQWVCKNATERFFNKESVIIIKKIEYFNNKIAKLKLASTLKKSVDGDLNADEINKVIYQTNMRIIGNSILLYSNKDEKDTLLTSKETNYLYNYFLNLFSNEIYSYNASLNLVKVMNEKNNEFSLLNIIKQIYLLTELLSYLKTNERKALNLEYLGLSKNCCTLFTNKKLKRGSSIIFESNCGFFKKPIKI